jgi:hypothetical protein
MSKQVIFRDRQELQAADLNNTGGFADAGLVQLTADAVSGGKHYAAGLATAISGTEVNVAPLRFYNAGAAYLSEQVQTLNLFQYLPLVTKKCVAIVVWGEAIDAQVEPRDFLIDLTTNATQPQAVAMERLNLANINALPGVESADPQPPSYQSGTLPIALVYLLPSGIERIDMQTVNQLPNAANQQARVELLEAWQELAEPRIDSIATDLSALAQKTDSKADRESVIQLANDLKAIKEAQVAPAAAVATTGNYGDTTQTSSGDAGYSAIVRDGVLFPEAAGQSMNLVLFNPIDPLVRVDANGLVLPKWNSVQKYNNYRKSIGGSIAISSYQNQALTLTAMNIPAHIRHYGPHQNNQNKWYSRHGWDNYGKDRDFELPNFGYVKITPKNNYDAGTTPVNISGAMISQTILIANAMWLSGIVVDFNSIGVSGDVTVVVSETLKGKPDLSRVLAQVAMLRADLRVNGAASSVNMVAIPPVFLDGGKYYAISVITQGDHRLSVSSQDDSTNGTLFYAQDGDYIEDSANRTLIFALYGCAFVSMRTVVSLQSLVLSGGLNDIHLDAPHIIPKGCALHYEIQPAGSGAWYPLGDSTLRLAAGPNMVNIRAVLLGTQAMAPGFKLTNNALRVSRAADAMVYWSTARTVTSTTSIVLSSLLHNWDAANHVYTPKVVIGGTEYAAAVTTFVTEDGARRYKHTFTVPATTTYKIKLTASKTTGAQPFTIAELIDSVL